MPFGVRKSSAFPKCSLRLMSGSAATGAAEPPEFLGNDGAAELLRTPNGIAEIHVRSPRELPPKALSWREWGDAPEAPT